MVRCKKTIPFKPRQILYIFAMAGFISPVLAGQLSEAEISEVTADWKCKWCPYEDTAKSAGNVEAGVGYVSNDSYKHGDYTGLNDKGAYFVGDLEYGYTGEKGTYSNVEAYDLGLDSRSIAADSGKQGKLGLELKYSELPKLNLDTARTPYSGSDNQTLPTGWVDAPTTPGMTELDNSLRYADISTKRKTLDLAANYHQTRSLSYGVSFQRSTKEGFRTLGLAIGGFAGSAILAVPVDYITDQGEVRVSYRKARWQANLSYEFSNFKNDSKSVRWDNAFSNPATATEGQAALEPDNTMQQFTLSGAYHFSQSTQASALISLGRLEQNDNFLPFTINGNITPPAALPRTSLDGKVNTFTGNLGVNSRLTEKLDLEARYKQNEQDNDTPLATYEYINTDNALGTPRTNIAYSFRQRELSLEGGYRLSKPHKFNAGYQYETVDRTNQEVDTTKQNSLWGSYRNTASEKWNWFARLELNSRSGDEYTGVFPGDPGFPDENPLLRKYNLADRDRNKAALSVTYMPNSAIQLTFLADYANDDYSDSQVGLKESEQHNYTLDFQYSINEAISFNVDFTRTNIDSRQNGITGIAVNSPTWSADNDDKVNVAHLGVLYRVIKEKLKLGFDYTYADSEGDISISTGLPYPTLTTTRHTFKIYGDYNLNERSILRVYYRYEEYDESNWAIDGVVPNTISNVLSMGEFSPDYNIGVFSVSLKYLF